MPSSEAVALVRAHRAQLAAIRQQVTRDVEARYADLDPNAIDASFNAMASDLVRSIEDGQGLAQDAAAAFVETYVSEDTGRTYRATRPARGVVGTRADGKTTLQEGMDPIIGLIKKAIGNSGSTEKGIEAGRYYTARYADSETLAAADRETAHQLRSGRRRITGWQRITAGTCKPCAAQLTGGLDDEFYRHASCKCVRVPVYKDSPAAPAPEEEAPAEEPTEPIAPAPDIDWPAPDMSPDGIEDATSAWTGIHYADLREYQMKGTVREGFSLADDPIHGISEQRAAQSVSTLTEAIANGETAPPLFRGLAVDDDTFTHFARLQPGQREDMALSAWSAESSEAVKFAARTRSDTPHSVLLEAVDTQGFNMAPHSFYPDEKEWITSGRFVVQDVETRGDALVVRLRQEAVWDAPRAGVK